MAKQPKNQVSSTPAVDIAAVPATVSIAEVQAVPPKIELAHIDAPKIESPNIEIVSIAPAQPDIASGEPAKPASTRAPGAPPRPTASVAQAADTPARSNRFALLAASVAVAAAFGAILGGLTASGLQSVAPQAAKTDNSDVQALRATIGELKVELAALRTSIEGNTRSANVQFNKVAERFDRIDRSQAEPAAKLAKAIEALDRLERRVEAAGAAKEVTGSIGTAPQPAAAVLPAPPPKSPLVEGWVLHEVYRGTAYIQGPRRGVIEVEAGDTIPGIGRIEAVRKQEGRWVVVTSKGLITSMR